jgi:hypothetical protein
MSERSLAWGDCPNARDFGGLRTRDGRVVRRGALARSGALDHLPDGYRTVIDLRNDDERPAGLRSLHMPLDGIEDRAFWDEWEFRPEFGTVYYYLPFLAHFPGRAARVVQAIAEAPPGGVAFHCRGGRDRTGLVAILTLTALGVVPEEIAADYAMSTREPAMDEVYAARGTTPEAAVLEVIEGLVPERDLAGVDIRRLRERLLE